MSLFDSRNSAPNRVGSALQNISNPLQSGSNDLFGAKKPATKKVPKAPRRAMSLAEELYDHPTSGIRSESSSEPESESTPLGTPMPDLTLAQKMYDHPTSWSDDDPRKIRAQQQDAQKAAMQSAFAPMPELTLAQKMYDHPTSWSDDDPRAIAASHGVTLFQAGYQPEAANTFATFQAASARQNLSTTTAPVEQESQPSRNSQEAVQVAGVGILSGLFGPNEAEKPGVSEGDLGALSVDPSNYTRWVDKGTRRNALTEELNALLAAPDQTPEVAEDIARVQRELFNLGATKEKSDGLLVMQRHQDAISIGKELIGTEGPFDKQYTAWAEKQGLPQTSFSELSEDQKNSFGQFIAIKRRDLITTLAGYVDSDVKENPGGAMYPNVAVDVLSALSANGHLSATEIQQYRGLSNPLRLGN